MTVPLDEGPASRGRYGPFWVEEGLGLVAVGALIVLVAAVVFLVALANRPA